MWHSNRVASPFFFFLDFQYPPNQFLVSGTAYGHQRVIYKRNSFVKFRRMANPCLLTGEPADSCRSSLMDGRFAALVRRIPRLVAWLCRRLEVLKGLTRRFVMEKCWSVGGVAFISNLLVWRTSSSPSAFAATSKAAATSSDWLTAWSVFDVEFTNYS